MGMMTERDAHSRRTVCMYVCICIGMHICIHLCMYVCIYMCRYDMSERCDGDGDGARSAF